MLHEEARVTAAVELKALEKLVKLNKIKLSECKVWHAVHLNYDNDYSAVSDRGA